MIPATAVADELFEDQAPTARNSALTARQVNRVKRKKIGNWLATFVCKPQRKYRIRSNMRMEIVFGTISTIAPAMASADGVTKANLLCLVSIGRWAKTVLS